MKTAGDSVEEKNRPLPESKASMTLTEDQFIGRFLLHVLPNGLHRIRYNGFLPPGSYSLEGASIDTDNDANKDLYGKEIGAREIVTGPQTVVSSAKSRVDLLDSTSPARK